MHTAAYEYVRQFATTEAISVIEIGSRNINGSVRPHFPSASYCGIDVSPGPGVDVVQDAATYYTEENVDIVVCCEVFEHTASWKQLIEKSYDWLKPGGRIIVTCAGIGRAEHSAIDGGYPLRNGEWYKNISARLLRDTLIGANFAEVFTVANSVPCDTYGTGLKGA